MSSFARSHRIRRLWSLLSQSTWSWATRSIPRTRCGSSVARCSGSKADCAQPASTATAAESCCSFCSRSFGSRHSPAVVALALAISTTAAWLVHVLLVYSLLALGDLLHHVWRIESAVRRDDIDRARHAVSALVGRDTDRMDGPACRRAAVESLSENLTDGFVSPVFWYVLGGVPGTRAVQDRQHDGLDGGLQDTAVPAIRLVWRTSGRRDELPAGATDMVA